MTEYFRMFSRASCRHALFAGLLATSLQGSALADWFGLNVERISYGNGLSAINLYASFDDPGDRVLAVEDATIFTNLPNGFVQAAASPYWKPVNQSSIASQDSCVCIDSSTTNSMIQAAGTIGLPTFLNYDASNGDTDFSYFRGALQGASWANADPSGTVGLADGGKVLLAHLVIGPGVNECAGLWAGMKVRYTRAQDGSTVVAEVPLAFIASVAASAVCGHNACTDCCVPNPFPIGSCADASCCQVVCPADPYCCDTWWDTACAQAAIELCGDCAPLCNGDLDHDGIVGGADLGMLLNAWQRPGVTDLNEDLTTNGADLGVLLNAWGSCP